MSSLPTFNAYDGGGSNPRNSHTLQQQQQQQQQPLRRGGAPVPAPPALLSTKSSATRSLHSTPVENFYDASTATTTSTPSSPPSYGGTAATSSTAQPHRRSSLRHRARDAPHSSSAAATTTAPATAATSTSTPALPSSATPSSYSHARRTPHGRSRRGDARSTPSVTSAPTPLNAITRPTTPAGTASNSKRHSSQSRRAPRSLSRRARDKSIRTPTPEDRLRGGERPCVPLSRGPGFTSSAAAVLNGPTIVRANSPAAAASSSARRSFPGDDIRVAGDQTSGGVRSHRTTNPSSALPPQARQETGAPTPARSSSASPSDKVVTAGPTIMSNVEREKAERAARKQLRSSMYNGHIKVHGYVAQTAYAQRNPFRCQDFAEFAANPKYQPPAGFDIYSQALATRVYGLEVSRASQGEFMMQRLVEAAHPATAEERAEMEALLSSTLEKLQGGDWFYKWTRINHVHQRYVWLNLQRATLMWSISPTQSVVLNAEIKLSTVTSITPDCLQLESPMRVFYRMTINTPDRCISLATEIRKKFDVWYRVLLQLTAPNLVYGVPGVWGRPSSSLNTTGRGAASRWASRFSPLDAVVNDTTGHLGNDDIYTHGLLSSSD
ncbi:hypothetical protein ABB37_00890 [Leptomonas pyrrhocoris]|uniref:Pleckstrin homology domain-containing protein n=1 Tax=Leptomonas pyrrhocoris TaxID=157538 RepID=A0A0N0VIA0_LEPPY|nr:hypothetical protein ABB37_00890 [Leptomonas pyrrhocoris]XP_015665277.1 hypothetical protein ABB37_00890 [Leptomonas pyrrhocoris]KPA86837.1 hypothetical protein ABB37_00890 [Leptomonas pyrrhocoris]KPA86838.1 hypothetical protein ABB37_00890 [Leptomonas pyrrhocoris]|eukprot:XP_015665276.1 hypothetical protein ABB37_00890 [Leptomonas pyrrhocoris]